MVWLELLDARELGTQRGDDCRGRRRFLARTYVAGE